MNDIQKNFLIRAAAEAVKSGYPYAKMAASEAALESSWGNSQLANDYKNLFGMKEHRHANPAIGVVRLPTREFEHGQWIPTGADWEVYPDWSSCFADRLSTLKRLASIYPHYAAALVATTAEEYVTEVSETWSTDPGWRCSCGEQFIVKAEGEAHATSAQHTLIEINGLGRALKCISIYQEFPATS